MKGKISFIVFTYNEEKRIKYVIENLINYGEVLVLDNSSTDNTKKISEELGAKYFVRPNIGKLEVENQETFDFIKSITQNSWFFWGFADYILPKQLLEKMVEISQQDNKKYVYIPIYTYLLGVTNKLMSKGCYPNFFRKEVVDFSNNHIHGMGKYLGKQNEIIYLQDKEENAIRHFSLYDLDKFISNHWRYAQIEALQKFENGRKFSLIYMLGAMLRYFVIYYKYSYKCGVRGLLVALEYVFFRFTVYARLYELENNITLESIENEYQKEKFKILSELK